jgi:uncharacterized protein (DUF2126 family)
VFIEVNIASAKSWQEIMECTTACTIWRSTSRLGTDKFMVDGRHGTGGGNHVTPSAAKPEDIHIT